MPQGDDEKTCCTFLFVLFPKFGQFSLTLHIKVVSIPTVFRNTPQYYEPSSSKTVGLKIARPHVV